MRAARAIPLSQDIATKTALEAARAFATRLYGALGEDTFSTIVLGGSAAAGCLAWVRRDDETVRLLSDLDLYVVIASEERRDTVRRAVRRAARDLPGGVVVDAGVVTAEELALQSMRPGTASLVTYGRVVRGDESTLAMLRKREIIVPPDESLYLIENRFAEYQNATRGENGVKQAYASLKLGEAVREAKEIAAAGTNNAIGDGARAGGHCAGTPGSGASGCFEEAIDKLRRVFSGGREGDVFMLDRIEEVAVEAWVDLARELLRLDGADLTLLLARRCRRGSWIPNARCAAAMFRNAGCSRTVSIVRGAKYGAFDPLTALRVLPLGTWAIRSGTLPGGAGNVEGEMRRYADRLTRACGAGEGNLAARALRVLRGDI